jgi:hypothetical protein
VARVLSYFRTPAEALHLAVEVRRDEWRPLNKNEPVLECTLDGGTIRDPFLFRDNDGRFHLFATTGWRGKMVLHAESDDLIKWSEQRGIDVLAGVPGAHNSWAPECFYDRTSRAYRLIWSTAIGPRNGPNDWNHRIWSCTTSDFRAFSPSEVYFDPGYSVIDATVWPADDGDYMVFKDERGDNVPDTEHKRLRTAFRPLGVAEFTRVSDEFTPALVEGPILSRRDGEWVLYYDCFMGSCWSAMRSRDFERWEPMDATFPHLARHGHVVEVSEEHRAALISRYGIGPD